MHAQNIIRKHGMTFVCLALEEVLFDEGVLDYYEGIQSEIFTEFSNLFDKTRWEKSGNCEYAYKGECWWEVGWSEPRIRALDCILRD